MAGNGVRQLGSGVRSTGATAEWGCGENAVTVALLQQRGGRHMSERSFDDDEFAITKEEGSIRKE